MEEELIAMNDNLTTIIRLMDKMEKNQREIIERLDEANTNLGYIETNTTQ